MVDVEELLKAWELEEYVQNFKGKTVLYQRHSEVSQSLVFGIVNNEKLY